MYREESPLTTSMTIALDRASVERRGLYEFVKRAWPQVEPSAFRGNWHIELICRYLERLHRGEIRNLCIMVPPGTGKSLITQVFFPAWIWSHDPQERFIFATYEANLGKKFARLQRALHVSRWWTDRWETSISRANESAAGFFKNFHGGSRFTTGTGGALTGHHAGILVGDDLVKAQAVLGGAAESQKVLDSGRDFWLRVMPTRQADPHTTRRILIQQRLHHKDPAGSWIEHDPSVVVICLPMRCEHAHPYYNPDIDPRSDGELLWPGHIPEAAVASLERDLGPFHAAAQLQQRPGRSDGEVFRREWLENTWTEISTKRDAMVGCISCDLTFGGKNDANSYVAIGVWVKIGPKTMLLYQHRGRHSYTETREQLRRVCSLYPHIRPVIVENKANGPAIIDDLKAEVPGIIPGNPSGSKLARAHSVTGYWAAGDVLLPAPGARYDGVPVDTSWVGAYKSELMSFTGSTADYDDQVDQTSQALTYLYKGARGGFLAAMEAARGTR